MYWLLALLAVVTCCYLAITWRHGFFKARGLHYEPPLPLFGNLGRVMLRREAMANIIRDVYTRHKQHGMFGMFEFMFPVTVVCDPDVIKLIAVKDSEYFADHRSAITEDIDPLIGKNLVSLQGQRWKSMRATLSPAFTSSKMKAMFLLVDECGKQMADHLNAGCNDVEGGVLSLDLKEFFTKYTNDVIATSAFGIHVDSLAQPDNEFYVMGKTATTTTGARMLVFMGFTFIPRIMKWLNFTLLPARVNAFFRTLVQDTIKTRDRLKIVRPDMIHLLMQARNGTLKQEDGEESIAELSDDDITAQAVLFFFAGFDTSSTLLCFAAHLLAAHEDVQRRAQAELDAVLEAGAGQLTYDGLQKLKYMDQILNETLRLYPPAPITDRKCVKPYKMAATMTSPAFNVNPGEGIWIPIHAIQRDPEHWERCDEFDPERFSDENKQSIKPFTYMPFGVGPRNCIGMRFAQMEAKIAVAHLLARFDLLLVEKTCHPLALDPKAFNMSAKGGFWLGVKRRAA